MHHGLVSNCLSYIHVNLVRITVVGVPLSNTRIYLPVAQGSSSKLSNSASGASLLS